ncbi:MerR family transcriptional regulator [Specibacter cremeus]|uniref:MerR family transcriptional regulator n=1 Tax=Specibacter cremeus TaxID=1629051 RepID=UPI00197CB3F4|nr:MerR family transcriptional regulator [Specibacter cremeus]
MTVMTIGALARHTGVPVKALRKYEELGLIYTVGRSPGNYRLFDDEALWCVGVVGALRDVGLTLSEIQDLAQMYLQRLDEPAGLRLAGLLDAVRARTQERIMELESLLARIDGFDALHADELAGRADPHVHDPHFAHKGIDSPPGAGPSLILR